jgi:hypothetical protein
MSEPKQRKLKQYAPVKSGEGSLGRRGIRLQAKTRKSGGSAYVSPAIQNLTLRRRPISERSVA